MDDANCAVDICCMSMSIDKQHEQTATRQRNISIPNPKLVSCTATSRIITQQNPVAVSIPAQYQFPCVVTTNAEATSTKPLEYRYATSHLNARPHHDGTSIQILIQSQIQIRTGQSSQQNKLKSRLVKAGLTRTRNLQAAPACNPARDKTLAHLPNLDQPGSRL